MDKSRLRKAVFPVNGQGTFIYTIRHKAEFTIFITPDKQKVPRLDADCNDAEVEVDESFDTDNFISLTVGDHFARFKLKMAKGEEEILLSEKYGKDIGIDPDKLVSSYTTPFCI